MTSLIPHLLWAMVTTYALYTCSHNAQYMAESVRPQYISVYDTSKFDHTKKTP